MLQVAPYASFGASFAGAANIVNRSGFAAVGAVFFYELVTGADSAAPSLCLGRVAGPEVSRAGGAGGVALSAATHFAAAAGAVFGAGGAVLTFSAFAYAVAAGNLA